MTTYKVLGFIRGVNGGIKFPPDIYKQFVFSDDEEHYGTDFAKWQSFLRSTVIPRLLRDNLSLQKSFFKNVHFMITTMGSNQSVLFPVVKGKFEKGYVKMYGVVI